MLLCYLTLVDFGPLGAPKTNQIWIQNGVHNGSPFRDVLGTQFGPVLGPFWAPKNRPKITSAALLAHLGTLKFHLGGPRISPSQLGPLMRPFGTLRGAFVPHFGLPDSHFDPPWPPFEALIGPFGALQAAFAYSSRSLPAMLRSTG